MTVTISTTSDVSECWALRKAVFVEEQNVPLEEEMDELDDQSTHFVAREMAGAPVGTARVYEVGATLKIGRVCVLKSHRGQGIGAGLIKAALVEATTRPQINQAKLGAQDHAIPFYESLGFRVVGDSYLDAGIAHHDMVRDL